MGASFDEWDVKQDSAFFDCGDAHSAVVVKLDRAIE
jgi:hypothetical protein